MFGRLEVRLLLYAVATGKSSNDSYCPLSFSAVETSAFAWFCLLMSSICPLSVSTSFRNSSTVLRSSMISSGTSGFFSRNLSRASPVGRAESDREDRSRGKSR